MAISDKLTYLNTTKSQLKDQINYGLPTEKQITSSTTFREYVGSIFEAFLEALRNPDTLFTNLPKTSGSGSQITLNGTANAPMRITLNPTALSQTTYTGKNLLQLNSQATYGGITFKPLENGKLSVVGTATTDIYSNIGTATLNTNTNYTLSCPQTISGMIPYLNSSVSSGGNWINVSTKQTTFQVSTAKSYNVAINIRNGATLNLEIELQLEAGSSMTSFEPYVGGTASPNPSYPQDIHTISGNNSVVVEGKNLFSEDNFIEAMKPNIGVSKTIVNNEEVLYVDPYNANKTTYKPNLKPNTQYTLTINVMSALGSGNAECYIDYSDGTMTYIIIATGDLSTTTYKTITKTSTSGKTITGIRFAFYGVVSNKYYFKNVMLNEGSTATTYTPYVSQTNPINLGEYELGTIGNYSNEFVRSDGKKNLFDISKVVKGRLDSGVIGYASATTSLTTTDTTISFTTNANYRGIVLDLIEVEPNTKYIYSSKNSNATLDITCACYDSSQTYIANASRSYVDEYTYRFTTKENTKYVRIGIQLASSGTTTILQPQFELGETALPYVPYEKGWYYKQGIGKVVLDGTQNITSCNVASGNSNMAYAYTTLLDNYIGSSDGLCDKLAKSNVELKSATNSNNEMFSLSANTWGGLRFYFDKTRLSEVSVAGFKTWLSNNNITIYYALKTPTYTKITGELAQELEQVYKGMLSYDGTTNISQVNNDLPFELVGSAITK